MNLEIDTETYKISSDNYYHTVYRKNQIILAGSLRKENFHIKRLQKKEYGKSKKWNTFTISRGGKIYQHYFPKYYTDFMSEKEIDKNSISVVLENMGMLYYNYECSKFLNSINEECNETLVFEKNWKGSRYWEKYTEEQFNSLVELCKYLTNEYNIILDSLGFNVYHVDTAKFKGIVCRSNYNENFTDLNPFFDFKKFIKELGIKYE